MVSSEVSPDTGALPIPEPKSHPWASYRTATHGRVATEIRDWATQSGYTVHPHDIPRRAFIAEAAANGQGLDELRDIAAVTVRDSFHELLTTLTAERT